MEFENVIPPDLVASIHLGASGKDVISAYGTWLEEPIDRLLSVYISGKQRGSGYRIEFDYEENHAPAVYISKHRIDGNDYIFKSSRDNEEFFEKLVDKHVLNHPLSCGHFMAEGLLDYMNNNA